MKLAGYHHGYFWSNEVGTVEKIRASGAQSLFVAITSPNKENFINRWHDQFGVSVVMGVGGTFDVVAGKVKRAPLQPYEGLPVLLASAACHLVIQKRGAADAVLPSKLTNILAAGGNAVITADADTTLGVLCTEHPGIAVLAYRLRVADSIMLALPDAQHERYRWWRPADMRESAAVHGNARAYVNDPAQAHRMTRWLRAPGPSALTRIDPASAQVIDPAI
ncbi:WecB/TagA/CpsF family glycosyltransferase [Aromatoleum bremense]|uniref:WecB/TagA/CpsF family glycosyltransferase n=1 Tax=Aromatoleum bremense TaxID=76115 RepID=UPI001BB5CCB9|nr:WecB/TagA/CpsF family glycosyltransferase [Aromatoleum bremense]QTQ33548.1 Putative N-acetylmannosaminyltransferase [Aromatoleum bremense]